MAAIAAVAFAENLLTRMPNCAKKTPEDTPDSTPAAPVTKAPSANEPSGRPSPALPAASGSSRVDSIMTAAAPTRTGRRAIQRPHCACRTPMNICVASSARMDIRYTASSTGSPASPTMFRLWNVMGTHARKHPSAIPVSASVCPSASFACAPPLASERATFSRAAAARLLSALPPRPALAFWLPPCALAFLPFPAVPSVAVWPLARVVSPAGSRSVEILCAVGFLMSLLGFSALRLTGVSLGALPSCMFA